VQVDLSSRNHAAMTHRTSRFVPFLIALTVCAASSVTLGFGAWYLFGKNQSAPQSKQPKVLANTAKQATANASLASAENGTSEETTAPSNSSAAAPAGTVFVAGATVELGGGHSKIPAQRVAVDPFFISETEVTNQQFQDFVKDTNHKAPAGWKDGEFPLGLGSQPVTALSWQDAVDYCQWLSTKTGTTVRLPSEAEWELAARGPEGLKYPWGNEWNDRATASENKNGFVHAVKSYPAGRSPSGAYDMAGNVWEWVGEARDADGNSVMSEGANNRVIKGGAANESQALISATSRNLIPKTYSGGFLGFRYVVVLPK
jgi:formylglycine-generating enzyme required for sulfatase activity